DRSPADGVALFRHGQDSGEGKLATAGPDQPHDGVGGGDRLQAAPVAAVTQRAVLVDGGVPDLTGGPTDAVVETAVDDQAGPDAAGGLDVDHVLRPLGGADRELGERTQIGVVVDLDRQTELLLHLVPDPNPD